MKMRYMLLFGVLVMCLLISGALGEPLSVAPERMGERFHMQDGVIYWIGNAEAVVVDFQKSAENITMRGTVEGLPVRCERIVWKDGLARTIVVEAGVQGLTYIELEAFLALETVDVYADVMDSYWDPHVRLMLCPALVEVTLHSLIDSSNAIWVARQCPNVTVTSYPLHTSSASRREDENVSPSDGESQEHIVAPDDFAEYAEHISYSDDELPSSLKTIELPNSSYYIEPYDWFEEDGAYAAFVGI